MLSAFASQGDFNGFRTHQLGILMASGTSVFPFFLSFSFSKRGLQRDGQLHMCWEKKSNFQHQLHRCGVHQIYITLTFGGG